LWRNSPAWVLIIKDLSCFALGLTGMGYLILSNSDNYLLIGACLFLTGLPGATSFFTLIANRRTGPDSPPVTTSQSSELPHG
jgi:hypothetical protein